MNIQKNESIQGIIFDMDNTLLRSHINFDLMRNEIYECLPSEILPPDFVLEEHTCATIIQAVQQSTASTDEIEKRMWEICTWHETKGMKGASLEEGVLELIEKISSQYHLVVFTNNSQAAAVAALQETRIAHYFEYIIGREQVPFMKPSSSGIEHILTYYPKTSTNDWIMVGDSWIDGKAAIDGGIQFIAYQGNQRKMDQHGIYPLAFINQISQLENYLRVVKNHE